MVPMVESSRFPPNHGVLTHAQHSQHSQQNTAVQRERLMALSQCRTSECIEKWEAWLKKMGPEPHHDDHICEDQFRSLCERL
eukprot:3209737-Amphidinium_carterae.1